MPDGEDLFDIGLEARRAALGSEYVDTSLANSDEFMMTCQRVVTELAGDMPGVVLGWITRPAS